MHLVVALALRRALLTGAALAATLVAHLLAVGDLPVQRTAPVLWTSLILGAAMCGPRRGLRVRSHAVLAAWLLALQTALHATLVAAPWALGIAPHHHDLPVVDARSAAAHAVAALVLAALLRRADLVLAAACAVTRAVARALGADAPRRAGSRPPLRAAVHVPTPRAGAPRRPRTSRGPPRLLPVLRPGA